MPKLRTPRRRSIPATPEQREDAVALLWRMDQIRNWKEAVHREAWRQTRADGSGHCDPAGFDAAEARLQAAGVDRPPEAWFDELTALGRLLAQENLAEDQG